MSVLVEKPMAIVDRSFGFDPEESKHHFVVRISRGSTQPIHISEHFSWTEKEGSSPMTLGSQDEGQIRVILARTKWDAVADETRVEFNLRLKKKGKKTGAWRVGDNLIRRELGKELVLLAWAIEDADPGLIPTAISNWKGLEPEERWWMYTQTAAATGHGVNDRGIGWRKAIRFALTENPIISGGQAKSVIPEFFKLASEKSLFSKTESLHRAKNSDNDK